MPDLKDGESVTMEGSGSKPYVLKNVGGVYSCSCPAWCNQSLGIERRTCKHIRILRGDVAERARLGALPAAPAKTTKEKVIAPPLLLAETWDGTQDLTNYWLSEKLDGVRAYWDGAKFLSRQGNVYHAPAWFTEGLPTLPLDGELWLGRKMFQRTVSIVRRQDETHHWREILFAVFDSPDTAKPFEERLKMLRKLIPETSSAHVQLHLQYPCRGPAHLRNELARIESLGGEGLMLRQPGSLYEPRRSTTLLKVKTFQDAEARVIGHQPGAGRHRGRLGALLVEFDDGIHFAVGTGLSDRERENPPPVGSTITFRYQELTDGGVPRFPSYLGVRGDIPIPSIHHKETLVTQATTPKRRFEFVEGASDKFWEIDVQETTVTVRYGRNGTHGQENLKTFADSSAASKHAEKLIRQKTGKGYVEIK